MLAASATWMSPGARRDSGNFGCRHCLSGGQATLQIVDLLLLVFADQTQLGHDIRQLLNVLVFDHQVDSVLTQTLNHVRIHGKPPPSKPSLFINNERRESAPCDREA